MQVTAVLAIRNEEAYLANCLRHLVRNGVSIVIVDNDSTDDGLAICRRREFAAHLVDIYSLPFAGVFSLDAQLRRKAEIFEAIETDWVIHLDADEIMHSGRKGETLRDALARVDAEGWNAVNFDEFVFVPVDHEYIPDSSEEEQPLLHYYFFEPIPQRLMRAWQKASGLSSVNSSGHILGGSELRLSPEPFALRHYIFRDQQHAFSKYTTRTYAEAELAVGSHSNRVGRPPEAFRFPPAQSLQRLMCPGDRNLQRTDPWQLHYWQYSQFLEG